MGSVNILITGANRGLGLAMVKHFLNLPNPPKFVIATFRDPKTSEELLGLAKQHENLKPIQLDVGNFEEYPRFAKEVEEIVKDDGLNLLINNAGMINNAAEKPENFLETLKINTVAPMFIIKNLLKLLQKAAKKNASKSMGYEKALIVNVSSGLGSITDNYQGPVASDTISYPFLAYKCSKAGLNRATRTLGVELSKDGIMVFSLCPGWVKTDLGGPNAALEIDESIPKVVKLVTSVNESHNGGYFRYDGTKIDW